MLLWSITLTLVLTILAGAGLFGCFAVALRLDLAERGGRPTRRRLTRPRSSHLAIETDRV